LGTDLRVRSRIEKLKRFTHYKNKILFKIDAKTIAKPLIYVKCKEELLEYLKSNYKLSSCSAFYGFYIVKINSMISCGSVNLKNPN
jgi:hypothetical protein